jgi:hypothetical protein
MKYKSFLAGFVTFLIVTGALYFVGEQFSVQWLMFSYEYENSADGFSFSASSFMPFVIGLIAGVIAEKLYMRKGMQKKLPDIY